jgi:acetyl-CoA C-acetyltransferase
VVEGLPLKTYDCSQITDGYASLILATEEGLAKLGVAKSDCVEIAGWGQATDPIRKAGRDVLHPAGAYRAMNARLTDMAGATARGRQRGRGARLLHRHGRASARKSSAKRSPAAARDTGWRARRGPMASAAINTSGGLIAKGHPIGATGIAMIGWSGAAAYRARRPRNCR